MQDATINAQVHRFRDHVGIYIGTGATVYLKPADARKVARALNRAAKSCTTESFADSSGNTAQFQFEGAR